MSRYGINMGATELVDEICLENEQSSKRMNAKP